MQVVDRLLESLDGLLMILHLLMGVCRHVEPVIDTPLVALLDGMLLHLLGNLHGPAATLTITGEEHLVSPGTIEHTIVASLLCSSFQTVCDTDELIVIIATIEFIHSGLQPFHLVGCSLLSTGIQHCQTQQQNHQESFHSALMTVKKSC